MLEQAFCHIPGISLKTEENLWAAGINCWQAVASHPELPPCRAAALNLNLAYTPFAESLRLPTTHRAANFICTG
ncbi:MAG: hypothetical protein ACYDCO_07580 [Armatimonadota bacterium]